MNCWRLWRYGRQILSCLEITDVEIELRRRNRSSVPCLPAGHIIMVDDRLYNTFEVFQHPIHRIVSTDEYEIYATTCFNYTL
jgi:hypothetical protein